MAKEPGSTAGPQPGPSGPHRFVPPEDDRMGAALSAGHTPGLAMTWAVDTAARAAREPRCAAIGCGRTREDPVHLPVDERLVGAG
jgi:hypothetical protein